MIVKELLEYCTADGVAQVIAEMARASKESLADLEKRCQLLIDEWKSTEDYCIIKDTNFCFVAVETEKYPAVPYVTLTNLDELIQNGYDLTKTTEYYWFWEQTLGISVDENSLSRYGADALIGGILYHLTCFDRTEEEIKPLRETVEKETGSSKISQTEFYLAINRQICERFKKK